MPQLNPTPWFFIMMLTWLTFLFMIQPKLLSLTQHNLPSNKTTSYAKATPWTWPWT